MRAALFILLLPIVCLGQHPLLTGAGIDWRRDTGTTRWYPTNAATPTLVWLETIPFTSISNSADLNRVWTWTNLANTANNFTSDQSAGPTNRTTGGGFSGTTPLANFLSVAGGDHRLISGNFMPSNITVMFVCRCTNSASSQAGLYFNGTQMRFQFNSAKLEMSEGIDTLTGPATIDTGWYILTAVFNGASSRIDTNGVTYKSGTVTFNGTANTAMYLGQFQTFKGDISRVWGWSNVLTAGEYTSAINQCKLDYGFP